LNSVLVVRRDNIGDLVCTTPLFSALRRRYPRAWIGALVNSYNAPVLDRNPDIDEVIAYTKLKHLEPGESRLAALRRRVGQLWALRRRRLDCVVLATPTVAPRTLTLARLLAPRRVVAFSEALSREVAGKHQVECVFALARQLGADGPIPPLTVVPDERLATQARTAFGSSAGPKVAVQISARRPAQQWPAGHFVELIKRLHALRASVMLLWSPGPADHPTHPGDDAKAAEIAEAVPVISYRTQELPTLIGALAAADAVITSDGGAMHLAAGLRKPVVCFFGDVPPEHWRPWGVPHRVLRAPSGKAWDIGVEETLAAFRDLMQLP